MSDLLDQVRKIWAPWAGWELVYWQPDSELPKEQQRIAGYVVVEKRILFDEIDSIAFAMLEEVKRKGLVVELQSVTYDDLAWDCMIHNDDAFAATARAATPQEATWKACIALAKARS